MFITNIEDFDQKLLYKCNYKLSTYLQENGFCLIGIDKDDNYCFYTTKELLDFLKKGGEE